MWCSLGSAVDSCSEPSSHQGPHRSAQGLGESHSQQLQTSGQPWSTLITGSFPESLAPITYNMASCSGATCWTSLVSCSGRWTEDVTDCAAWLQSGSMMCIKLLGMRRTHWNLKRALGLASERCWNHCSQKKTYSKQLTCLGTLELSTQLSLCWPMLLSTLPRGNSALSATWHK